MTDYLNWLPIVKLKKKSVVEDLGGWIAHLYLHYDEYKTKTVLVLVATTGSATTSTLKLPAFGTNVGPVRKATQLQIIQEQ